MSLSLNTFEKHIDARILDRGYDYYDTGCVRSITRLSDTVWEAIVEGNRMYRVTINIAKNVIKTMDCTCPYDWGPVCKHQVAALLALRTKTPAASKRTKEPSVEERVKAIVKKRNKKQLEELILEEALNNQEFRNRLFARYAAESPSSATTEFKAIVRAYIISVTDYDDYYGDMEPEFTEPLRIMLDKAMKTARSARPTAVLPLCRTAVDAIIPELNGSHETFGLEYLLDAILNILRAMPRSRLNAADRNEVIAYCLANANQREFKNNGYDWDFIAAAAGLADTTGEEQRIVACMDRHEQPLFDTDGEKRIAVEYGMRKRIGTRKERDAFIAKNLCYRYIRDEAVKSALKAKDFETAEQLAREGLKLETGKRYTDERHWYEILMDIAVRARDKTKINEFGLILLEKTHEYKWYALLKKKTPASTWPGVLNTILSILTRHGGGLHHDALPRILIREKKLDRLMALVRERPSFHTLSTYDTVLKKDYLSELTDLYTKAIKKYLKTQMGRAAYQETARMLRRMKKWAQPTRFRKSSCISKRPMPAVPPCSTN